MIMDLPQDSSLRSELIRAVAKHEGWEESAVVLVDEAIIPTIVEWTRPPPCS